MERITKIASKSQMNRIQNPSPNQKRNKKNLKKKSNLRMRSLKRKKTMMRMKKKMMRKKKKRRISLMNLKR